jgi:hypothetical protein
MPPTDGRQAWKNHPGQAELETVEAKAAESGSPQIQLGIQ